MSDSGELFSVEFEPFGAHRSLVQWFTKQGGLALFWQRMAHPCASANYRRSSHRPYRAGNGRAEVREITIEPPNGLGVGALLARTRQHSIVRADPIQNREAVVLVKLASMAQHRRSPPRR